MSDTAERWVKWLRAVARERHRYPQLQRPELPSMGAITGQDFRTLAAIAHCWELYFLGDGDGQRGALEAVRSLLPALQRHCWPFARALIAFSGDWPDCDRVWSRVVGPQRELLQ